MSDVLIKVPALGESVTEAIIARLYKKTGEGIDEGEVVVELETDKVTLEVNAPTTGILQQLSVSEGDTVKIGDVIGSILEGTKSDLTAKESPTLPSATEPSPPQKKSDPQTKEAPAHSPSSGLSEIMASPAARKLMEENHLGVESVKGTGKNGRITKEDVIMREEQTPTNASLPLSTTPLDGLVERKPMTPLRKKIAERLKYAQNTAAILTTFNECDMSTVMELRKTYQDEFVKKYGTKLGFMSFFVKACVHALKEMPSVNAEIDGDDVVYHHHYDLGVAVSAPQGLVVPVLRNADKLGLHEIEQVIASFGEKAKAGKLTLQEMAGGTFTISNGGVFGSLVSTPILNPPQSAILGMHKIQERPVAISGQVVIRPMMYLALSYDHRIIDGREAVTFLVKIKEYMENPTRLLLGI